MNQKKQMAYSREPLQHEEWPQSDSRFGPLPGESAGKEAESQTREAQPPPGRDVDSIRYGILQRVAPALRHDMVVNLQAVTMMADVLSARLERGDADNATLHKSISKINRLVREAVSASLKVATWIDPGEDEGINLSAGVHDCVSLLAASFNFRSLRIVNNVPALKFDVSRSALRNLLAASLFLIAGDAEGPADITIDGEISGTHALLTLRCVARDEEADLLGAEPPPGFQSRMLGWEDVCALADAESVELLRSGQEVSLGMPRVRATRPLKMAAA